MEDKIKYEMEFPIHASPSLLYQYISTPSGLSEWYADNVNSIIGDALAISDLIRLEIHGERDQIEKLRAPFSDLNPEYFEFQHGIGKP